MDHTFPKFRSIKMDLLERFFHLPPSPSSGGASLALLCLLGESEPLGISFPSPGAPGFQPKSSQLLRIPNSPQISRME